MIERLSELCHLRNILKEFPKNIKLCFAYGSGAFKQLNNDGNNMLDLVFVVHNANNWHAENLVHNSHHYAQPLTLFGHKIVTKLQEGWGAKIYYNTLVKTSSGATIKYGVMSEVSLMEDLLDWNDLYMAGRLHKPVKVLIEPDETSQLRIALVQNLHSAVHAALLLLPEHFTEIDFYKTIAGLSYNGDFRMIFGENKDKVNNIVVPQLVKFRKLYASILKHFDEYMDIPKSDDMCIMCHQDTSPASKIHHLNHLPRTPQIKLVRKWSQGPRSKDTEDCLRAIAHDPECSQILEECLKEIVWKSSISQSLKGILTAGLLKSIKYSGAKISKMLRTNPPKSIPPVQQSSEITSVVETIIKKQAENKDAEKRLEYK